MKRRKLNWDDLKRIIELKTFYLVIVLTILGILFLCLDYFVCQKYPDSIFAGTLSALGITFITSSTVSLLMEIFLRLDLVDFMTERMLLLMPEEIKGNTGVIEFNKDRKSIDFKEYLINVQDYIKIMGVSSNDILASANMPIIKKKLIENPNFNIQILLLCPWSVTAEIRSTAKTYRTHNEGIAKTQAVILDICNLIKNMKADGLDVSRISLRLYDDIPSLSLVIDSEFAIVAPFMVVEQGGSSPYYIVRKLDIPNGIYDLYRDHFDTVWQKAIDVDDETSLDDIYSEQKNRDLKRVQNNPENYSDWVLSLNNARATRGN